MAHGTAISRWELDVLRDALVDFYTHHCRIEASAQGDDQWGGTEETRTARADNVPCYVEGGVAHEQDRVLMEGVARESEFFTISLPAHTDVRNGDVITLYPDYDDPTAVAIEVRVTAVVGPESHELERRALGYRTS